MAMAQTEEQQVDALFANWNKQDTPGAAIEVIRNGKVLLRKGYGMADLERGTPITPSTVFNIGSTSKQFTAFSIYLLAQDSKLALDDDVRKYIPELPDFGHRITIRQLLQHTSGLRDYINLMILAGWRVDDAITQDDALVMINRQSKLNSAPGQEYSYSNTGYLLAAMIVERVSGKSLSAFAKTRIFEPLGMKHTSIPQNYGTIVPARALAYIRNTDGGYQYAANSMSVMGGGGVMTTVDDLALWDRNFYEGRVGGKELIAKMQAPGVLNSGVLTNYAAGLFVESYRGQKVIEHDGFLPGLQSQFSRFPGKHFTVTVLANTGDFNPTVMARSISDIYLNKELAPIPAAAPQEAQRVAIDIDPARLDGLLGYYALSPSFGLTFTKEGGRLMGQGTGQPQFTLSAASERIFFFLPGGIELTFDPSGKDGMSPRVILRQGGKDLQAMRSGAPSGPDFTPFEGEFYSAELHTVYKIKQKGDKLTLSYSRGTAELVSVDVEKFSVEGIGDIKFMCATKTECNSFTAENPRARNVKFSRLSTIQ